MTTAISVEHLSKAYRIGLAQELPDTLVGAVTGWAAAPFRGFRSLRRLNTFGRDHDGQDTLWALRDVSFDVQEGEVVGIIGRNGAGKSTLLKILSRITEPTGGRAVVRGRVSSLLEVGTGFHPELTGRENVYMNGTILGMTKREIDRKFDDIVAFSGVTRFLDTPIKRYSSGMKVRLAFSVAAYLEPEILIIDEVLAVGDAEFQTRCVGKMEDVARCGRTVLFVSHNLPAVDRLCNRAVLLHNGSVVNIGSTGDIIEEYHSRTRTNVSETRWVRAGGEPDNVPAFLANAGMRTASGKEPREFPAGTLLEFYATCIVRDTMPLPRLGVGLDDDTSRRIATLHTDFGALRTSTRLVRGPIRLTCRLPTMTLAPARYSVKLSLEDRTGPLEVIDPAFTFTVVPSDYYRTGGRLGRGVILCPQEWSVEEALDESSMDRTEDIGDDNTHVGRTH